MCASCKFGGGVLRGAGCLRPPLVDLLACGALQADAGRALRWWLDLLLGICSCASTIAHHALLALRKVPAG